MLTIELRLSLFGDSVSPWNKLLGDSVMKRKTTREFSGICILFPEHFQPMRGSVTKL